MKEHHVDWFLSETENTVNGKPSVKWWSDIIVAGTSQYDCKSWVGIKEMYIVAKEVLGEE